MGFLSNAVSRIATAWVESQASDDSTPSDSRIEPVAESDFEAAVRAVAPRYDVADIEFTGPSKVKLMLWSNSHKSQWDGYVNFDLDAGTFTAFSTSTYGSPKPHALGYAVLEELGL